MTAQQDAVVAAARSVIGDQYGWGDEGPNAFDCSGLTQWCYAQIGVSIPRTSEEQAAGGIPVAYSDLQPGDLIIYYPDASHVAMYSGKGFVIQASTYGVAIEEVPVEAAGPYNQARRYLTTENTMTLYGVDVSNNNWSSVAECQNFIAQLKTEGFAFLEAKVSEGNYYQDPYWPVTLEAANAVGLPVVGYHYVTTNDPASQAQTFVGNGGGSVAMLDFEANSGTIANFWACVAAFNDAGVKIVLSYIPRWYWQEIGSPDLTGVPGLVASDYVNGSGYASELYPGDDSSFWAAYGNATPAILQFTDAANVAGISVDANAFVGTLDQLQQLLGGPVSQPTPTPAAPTTNPPAIPIPPAQADQVVELWTQLLTRWDFLGGNTVAEALGAIGEKLGLPGYSNPFTGGNS